MAIKELYSKRIGERSRLIISRAANKNSLWRHETPAETSTYFFAFMKVSRVGGMCGLCLLIGPLNVFYGWLKRK